MPNDGWITMASSATWSTNMQVTVKPHCSDGRCNHLATVMAKWKCPCGEAKEKPYCDKHFDDLLRRKRTHGCNLQDRRVRYDGHKRL